MAVVAAFHNGTYTAAQGRALWYGGPMASAASGITPRSGVITGPADSLKVDVAAGMAVTLRPGYAMVAGYEVFVDVDTVWPIEASTTTARWDVVGLRVYDVEAGDAGPSRAVPYVVKGTTTAEASFPARFIPLARVLVRASTSSIIGSDITDRRDRTAAAGGIIPYPGAHSTTPAVVGVAAGQAVWDEQVGRLIVAASSSAWVRVGPTPPSGSGWSYGSGAPVARNTTWTDTNVLNLTGLVTGQVVDVQLSMRVQIESPTVQTADPQMATTGLTGVVGLLTLDRYPAPAADVFDIVMHRRRLFTASATSATIRPQLAAGGGTSRLLVMHAAIIATVY